MGFRVKYVLGLRVLGCLYSTSTLSAFYTLGPTPCTLHPAPCTLHPAPCTLHPAPCTLHPTPCTLHPEPISLNSTRQYSETYTSHLTLHTLDPAFGVRRSTTYGGFVTYASHSAGSSSLQGLAFHWSCSIALAFHWSCSIALAFHWSCSIALAFHWS
jgi:hypothetical protein